MPPPGDSRAARIEVELRDPVWERGYARSSRPWWRSPAVSTPFNTSPSVATWSLVFGALVLLLLGMVLWR